MQIKMAHYIDGIIRRADLRDAHCLFRIRDVAIRVIAPRGMPQSLADRWADSWTVDQAEVVLKRRDVWVFEYAGKTVGWISITNSTIDGLYTNPSYERSGVASQLLAFVEKELRDRGVRQIQLEASWNAEEFYLRRGYKVDGPRSLDGPRRMRKGLVV